MVRNVRKKPLIWNDLHCLWSISLRWWRPINGCSHWSFCVFLFIVGMSTASRTMSEEDIAMGAKCRTTS